MQLPSTNGAHLCTYQKLLHRTGVVADSEAVLGKLLTSAKARFDTACLPDTDDIDRCAGDVVQMPLIQITLCPRTNAV